MYLNKHGQKVALDQMHRASMRGNEIAQYFGFKKKKKRIQKEKLSF